MSSEIYGLSIFATSTNISKHNAKATKYGKIGKVHLRWHHTFWLPFIFFSNIQTLIAYRIQ